AQTWVGSVLRVSAIDAADIPAQNLEGRDAVFFGVGGELRKFIEAMRNHIFAVEQDDGLPCIFLAQPIRRTAHREMLIEPRSINSAGLVPISFVHFERHGAR